MSQESAKRVRMGAEERRSLLRDTAKSLFAQHGYGPVGLARIAEEAGVSKTLLYHYFPDGRPQLYREIVAGLSGEMTALIRESMRMPVNLERRVARAVKAFIEFLAADPAAYRLLFLEPWGTGDEGIIGQAMAVQVGVSAELAQVLAPSAVSAGASLVASAATFGSLLQVAELCASGQIETETAVSTGIGYILGGLEGAGLVGSHFTED